MSKKVNLYVDQGSEFTTSIAVSANGTPLDMSDYTIQGQIRKSFSSSAYTEFDCTANVGYVSMTLNSTASSSMEPGKFVYDCFITDLDGNRTRVQEGVLELSAAVTR